MHATDRPLQPHSHFVKNINVTFFRKLKIVRDSGLRCNKALLLGPEGTGPQLLSRGTNKLLVPQLLAVVSCEIRSIDDFVAYAMM